MKTILVDAINGLILEDGTVFQGMFEMLEKYPNNKIVLTGANDEQFKHFNLDESPYPVFTLKHDPEKTDPAYFTRLLTEYKLTPETLYILSTAWTRSRAQSQSVLKHISTITQKRT